ncbi:MAG: DUF2029 domain-containing protein [Alphaproteobacteria bacterium]|nr:DUF2029 domain-containing protein [Alphaproteobacteria bacterium]
MARVAKFAALGFAIAFAALLTQSRDLVFSSGRAVGADFVTFWAASDLALSGRPASAYDEAAIIAAERKALPKAQDVYLWHYPPPFQLVVLPLALVPYLWAYGLWLAAWLAIYAATFRAAFRDPAPFWLAIGASAVYVNALHGQNGLMTAALAAGGLLLLERKPLLAGLLIGALCYKPHLGLPLGLLLLAGGHWRAAFGAVLSAIALCGFSALLFGIDTWQAFLANAATARAVLEGGAVPWHKMASMFATVRLAGGGLGLAYIVHGAVAAAVLAMTMLAWRRPGLFELKVALAVLTALLVSPYLFDYDLAVTALALGLLLRDGFARGWRPGMRPAIVVLWLAPAVLSYVAEATHVQLQPIVLLAAWLLTWQRLRAA